MEIKGKILAVDFGLKRIGLAISDEYRIIPRPLKTIFNSDSSLNEIQEIINSEKVNLVLFGLPIRNDDKNNALINAIYSFSNLIKKANPNINIEFIDEFMTSKRAVQIMVNNGKKKNKRAEKPEIDKIAAALILQEYLESN